MNRDVIKEITVKASCQKVWLALTNPSEMKKWYFDLPEFKAETGYKFTFEGISSEGKTYVHHCEIVEVVQSRKLRYTWTYEGYSGQSMVSFELVPLAGETLIILVHSGIDTFPKTNTDLSFKNFDTGWEAIIGDSLRNLLGN